jgi:hypothetical protein
MCTHSIKVKVTELPPGLVVVSEHTNLWHDNIWTEIHGWTRLLQAIMVTARTFSRLINTRGTYCPTVLGSVDIGATLLEKADVTTWYPSETIARFDKPAVRFP